MAAMPRTPFDQAVEAIAENPKLTQVPRVRCRVTTHHAPDHLLPAARLL
jgi:hypothetical protein